jgi:hypothetical protein
MALGYEVCPAVAANTMFRQELFTGSMMRTAIGVLLAAMSLVFSGCFQDAPSSSASVGRSPQAIAKGIPRQPALENKQAAAHSGSIPGSIREYPFPASPYLVDPQDLDLPSVISPDSGRHLHGTPSNNPFASRRNASRSAQQTQSRNAAASREIAGALLDLSFESLFASVFNRQEIQAAKDDLSNPFADAKKTGDAVKAQPAATNSPSTSAAPTPASKDPSPAPTSSQSGQSAANSGGMVGSDQKFMFLGDFDGSGVLKCVSAQRVGDATFSFDDGTRSFVIVDNQAAVENQRSFAVEDMDGDGNMDLLQTSRAALFGAMFLGDGSGNFNYANYFLTGYEPTVAVPGPMGDGGREVLVMDLRTGNFTAFRPSGIYLPYRQGALSFIPDYMAHLVELATGMDYLMAAQTGNAPRLYQWSQGANLAASSQALPGGPSLSVINDSQSSTTLGSVQVFQTGAYASVMLTNNQGQAFNVANMHVSSKIFLVIGNVENRGTLDVGVAFLVSFN